MPTRALRRARLHDEPPALVTVPPTNAGMPINIVGLEKSFGTNRVLRDVNLHLRASQFVAIIGRSGCGKSTLLRLLLGLERADGGRIEYGDDGTRNPEKDAVRVMFQEPRLLPWARVLANVEVGLGASRGRPDAHERALATLREVGLENRRDDWPMVLSGGQKQRVALARALVSRPRVLAFDEPLGALDALTRISMQSLLERIWLHERFTAIMVTHDVAEAVTLADRIVMIDDGEVTLDISVDLPRPRERGAGEVAALEGRILRELFRNARSADGLGPVERHARGR
jgi:sulfonate transport system ATP-binding protein